MRKRHGVIDLGTNTFHLLVVEQDEQGKVLVLHRERHYVKLAEGGISRIKSPAFVRALNTLGRFSERLKEWEVDQVSAMGTAALRKAENSAEFIKTVAQQTGIQISVISGDAEATYIWRGVRQAIPLGNQPHLIMDIGGGSVEFIISDQTQIHWRRSYPIGVAVLRHRFHHQEPLAASEQEQLTDFLFTTLSDLLEACQKHQVTSLLGASGTFDVVLQHLPDPNQKNTVVLSDFLVWQQKITGMTLEERLNDSDIPTNRADMIVVALLLIQFILDKVGITSLQVSPFAMKEGILEAVFEEVE